MGSPAAEIFRQAAQLNRQDPRRRGNLVELEPGMRVIVTGDIHGYRQALARILAFCGQQAGPWRLVLQEIIHGPSDPSGHDRSAELLLRAARAKQERPEQVLFLMGNHDLSQLTRTEISKDSRGACDSFTKGLRHVFEDQADEVAAAVEEFLRSLPMAVRTPNRVLITHSLPSPHRMERAPADVLLRDYRKGDFERGGPAYEWTWGRNQTPEQTDELARQLDVDFFILGHRRTPSGCELILPRALTLACDHAHGCLLCFDSDKPFDPNRLCDGLKYLAEILPDGTTA
jgi:hypothetical protein